LRSFLTTGGVWAVFLGVMLATLWALALHNAGFHIAAGAYAGWKDLGDQKLTHSVIVVIMSVVTLSALRPRGWWWIALLVLAVRDAVPVGRAEGLGGGGDRGRGGADDIGPGGIDARALGIGLGAAACVAIATLLAPIVPYLEKQLFSSMDFVTLLLSDETGHPATATTESNRNRLAMIEIALQQLREHPVFGIGPEAFRSDALTRGFLPIPVVPYRVRAA
jgi:hypothetical protein